MQGKYESRLRYWFTKLYRGLLRLVLRPLVRFPRGGEYEDGYTIIIGSVGALPDLLASNLKCLAKQDLESLRETLVVLDVPPESEGFDLEQRVRTEFPKLRCRFVYWNRLQRFVSRTVRWGWVNSWLSWSTGIAESRTRHAMLHDFDAMLIRPDFIEARYRRILELGCEYLGVQHYLGQGLGPEDGLVTTFELFFDVPFVVERFKPVHLFNHVSMLEGRSIDFDTFLWAQSRGGRKETLPSSLDEMVHPSQMICQYVYYKNADRRLSLTWNNLMLLPYFFSVGGSAETLTRLTREMRSRDDGRVDLFDRPLDLSHLNPEHIAWIVEQSTHLDQAINGEVRPDVREYLKALEGYAGKGVRPEDAQAVAS